MEGDAAANYRMLEAVGCPVSFEPTPEMETATLIVALLGDRNSRRREGTALKLESAP